MRNNLNIKKQRINEFTFPHEKGRSKKIAKNKIGWREDP